MQQDNTRQAQGDEQFFIGLCETALAGEHNKFEYIKNIKEFFIIRKAKSGLKKIVKVFDKVCNTAFKDYCKQVKSGTADFNLLYIYTQYRACKKFYEEELETLKDMTDEYWTYIDSGNFLNQFLFFKTREYHELYDFRKHQETGDNQTYLF